MGIQSGEHYQITHNVTTKDDTIKELVNELSNFIQIVRVNDIGYERAMVRAQGLIDKISRASSDQPVPGPVTGI